MSTMIIFVFISLSTNIFYHILSFFKWWRFDSRHMDVFQPIHSFQNFAFTYSKKKFIVCNLYIPEGKKGYDVVSKADRWFDIPEF